MATPRETRTSDFYVVVTPSDDAGDNLDQFRALYVGASGDLAVVRPDGVAVTFTGVAGGTILPVQGVRVNSTGTTADSIVALY